MQSTAEVVGECREAGYDVTRSYVAYLIADCVIPKPAKGPGECFLWMPVDVARLKRELRRRRRMVRGR